MKVEFENCCVPVWKLRTGTVVALEVGEHTDYCNISSINQRRNGEWEINVVLGNKVVGVIPNKLIWLEPF